MAPRILNGPVSILWSCRILRPALDTLAGFSDATFDYLFGKNVRLGKSIITISQGSEELEDILLLR